MAASKALRYKGALLLALWAKIQGATRSIRRHRSCSSIPATFPETLEHLHRTHHLGPRDVRTVGPSPEEWGEPTPISAGRPGILDGCRAFLFRWRHRSVQQRPPMLDCLAACGSRRRCSVSPCCSRSTVPIPDQSAGSLEPGFSIPMPGHHPPPADLLASVRYLSTGCALCTSPVLPGRGSASRPLARPRQDRAVGGGEGQWWHPSHPRYWRSFSPA